MVGRLETRERSLAAALLLLASCAKPAQTAGTDPANCQSPASTQQTPTKGVPVAERAPRLIRLEGGSFDMGANQGLFAEDAKPVHRVTVASFALGETEVTAGQYAACVAAGVCRTQESVLWDHALSFSGEEKQLAMDNEACNFGRADRSDHPMNCVDWYQAARFCAWAFQRLPSEAEWEYAARGAAARAYPWGDQEPTADRANISGEEEHAMYRAADVTGWSYKHGWHDGYLTTAPVRSLPNGRTAQGIYALAGNVQEWTSSFFCLYSAEPCAPQRRVVRGDGWSSYEVFPAYVRNAEFPMRRESYIGFRCAADARAP